MAESHDFRIIDDITKRRYILTKLGEYEIQLFDTQVNALPENHPDFSEWQFQYNAILQEIEKLYKVYEELGGTYDKQEIRSVINHSH